MIYATEQQVVVTAVLIVFCTLVALFIGMWWGHGRGLEQAAEEQRWEREQAKARRAHPVYRQPPEIAHDSWSAEVAAWEADKAEWRAHQDQALTLANGSIILPDRRELPITTGEIQAITDEMDAWLAQHVYAAPADYGQWLERQDGHVSDG